MNPLRYVLFLCGQLGMMALARFFFQWLLRFADSETAQGHLFAASAVGATFLAFRVFDGVTDPVAGALSDGWAKRGRQRRSLLWFSFAIPSVGMILLFAPDADMGSGLRWLLLASGMLVFFIGYTLYAIPYWSLLGDYAQGEPRVRSTLSNLLGAGALIATALGFVLSPMLVEKLGFFRAAVCFALPAAALMILPYWAKPPDTSAAAARSSSPEQLDAGGGMAGFKMAFADRRFLAVVLLFAGGQMSFTVMTAAAPYIAVELLGGELSDVAKLLGPFLLSAIPCFVFVPRFSRRVGWEKSVIYASCALAVAYAGTGGLGQALVGTPMVSAMLLFSLAGPMAAVLLGLEAEAVAACAQERPGEVTSIYFGVYNLVVKALNGAAMTVTGVLADAASTHGTIAVRAMGFCAGGVLVVGVLVYAAVKPRRAPNLEPVS